MESLMEGVTTKGDHFALEQFFVYYCPTFLKCSFLDSVNEGYQKLVPYLQQRTEQLLTEFKRECTAEKRKENHIELVEAFGKECFDFLDRWKAGFKEVTGNEALFQNQILIPWFENKAHSFIEKAPSIAIQHLKTEKEKKPEQQSIESFQSFLQDQLHPTALLLNGYSHSHKLLPIF